MNDPPAPRPAHGLPRCSRPGDAPKTSHPEFPPMAQSWWRQLVAKRCGGGMRTSRRRRDVAPPHRLTTSRPRLETLEDRSVPANLVVGTPSLLGTAPGNQDENWIAINPTNPNNLAAV